MTVWFDVEDLFDYARAGHKRVSGIQRLTLEIYRAAVELGGVRFLRHTQRGDAFAIVDWAEVEAHFRDEPAVPAAQPALDTPVARRTGLPDLSRRAVALLPDPVRKPLVLASVTQAQAVASAGLFAAGLGRSAVFRASRSLRRPSGVSTAPASFDLEAKPGDTLLVLGSPWFRSGYGALVRRLRDERRMRFGVLVCDLVPVRRPEWSDEGVRRTFRTWYGDVLPLCDLVMAISRHTAGEVAGYAAELGLTLPRPVCVLPIGSGFGAQPARPARQCVGNYVLFVSTLEARKNHALMVEVWRQLLREVRAGTRSAASVPDLVFAGRVGWLVRDLMQELANTDWLQGRIRLVEAPTDVELQSLYDGALFTVFPSLHEGWGLPVTESLVRGVPCLCSNAASLPEAGGALCRYFDPESVPSAHHAVSAVLDDRQELEAWRDRVRREFRPVSWTDTARAVLDEAAAAA